jgi:pyroglutamyl-peptidase
VDSVLAPLRLTRAIREVKPDALILLGEAGGSQTIRLETTAWNEMDFRIPDIAGRQPQKQAIHPSAPDVLHSTLPLEHIHDRLREAGHEVSLSSDPGRYLCNQVLFHALMLVGSTIPAGFIHLPLEQDYTTERAANALEAAVSVIIKIENTAVPSAGRRVARSGWR